MAVRKPPGNSAHDRKKRKRRQKERSTDESTGIRKVQREIDRLQGDIDYLEKKPEIYQGLSAAVRRKRTVDQMPKSNIVIVTAIALIGFLGLACGFFSCRRATSTLRTCFFSSRGVPVLLAGGRHHFRSGPIRRGLSVKLNWERARWRIQQTISPESPDFFLPPQYAHPVVCRRMIRILESGRASTCREALEVVKSDLKGLNSEVRVSQEEYDEVIRVKPLFLECDYKDKI